MKKIAGFLVIIILAGCLNVNAQRGMHGFRPDSVSMKQDSMSMRTPGRHHGEYYRMMPQHRSQMMRAHANGWMAQGMEPGHGMGMMNGSPGRRIMESIPNITQKQKDDLAKINEQNRSEMKKLMEQHQQAVKQLREEHRSKVMNLLTDEQKKWLEEHNPESRSN